MPKNMTLDSSRNSLNSLFGGALAHIACYMETGCYRSAYLAKLVLEQIARADGCGDLRHEAAQLIDVLESKAGLPAEIPHRPPRFVAKRYSALSRDVGADSIRSFWKESPR